MNGNTFSTRNYMVPSNGTTQAVSFVADFTAQPQLIDWRQYSVDNAPFQPQGVYIDNTQGTGALSITIVPLGWTISCPAGSQLATSFPAPNGQTCEVTGNGQAQLIFVDYPVLPSGTDVTVSGTVSVDIANVTTVNPLPTVPSPTSQGLPYRAQEYVPAAEYHYLSLSGATTTVNVVPATANQNLRKLKISASGDATLAAAGEITLTATLNGATIFKRTVYLTATTPANSPMIEVLCDEDFDMIGLNAGAAGNLTVAITTALATGKIDVNAYFTPQ